MERRGMSPLEDMEITNVERKGATPSPVIVSEAKDLGGGAPSGVTLQRLR
jgi:hypothetical protein